VLPQQEVHLVEPVDVYRGGTEGVQDGTEESKDVPQLTVSASLHRVPVPTILVPREVVLVLILTLDGSLLPQTARLVDLSYGLLDDMVYHPALHHMKYLLRYRTLLR
jgi:hypothetical protein